MRRREFITLLGSAALACPITARAQQPKVPVIGFLTLSSASRSDSFVAGFRLGLRETGFVESSTVHIEYRYANGHIERLSELAADLVRRRVTLLVSGARTQDEARAAAGTIPIVFMVGGDPVKAGLVASLNRPGGNLTGVTMLAPELEAKRIGLLQELVPQNAAIGAFVDPQGSSAGFTLKELQAAERKTGRRIIIVNANNENDFETAFATLAHGGAGALIVTASILFNNFRQRLIALAAHHKIPAMYELREFPEAGGLMSYGPSLQDAFRQIGVYAGRILKGEKAADLPVMQPSKFDFVINLKTARALGLTLPPQLLALADEVIE